MPKRSTKSIRARTGSARTKNAIFMLDTGPSATPSPSTPIKRKTISVGNEGQWTHKELLIGDIVEALEEDKYGTKAGGWITKMRGRQYRIVAKDLASNHYDKPDAVRWEVYKLEDVATGERLKNLYSGIWLKLDPFMRDVMEALESGI